MNIVAIDVSNVFFVLIILNLYGWWVFKQYFIIILQMKYIMKKNVTISPIILKKYKFGISPYWLHLYFFDNIISVTLRLLLIMEWLNWDQQKTRLPRDCDYFEGNMYNDDLIFNYDNYD